MSSATILNTALRSVFFQNETNRILPPPRRLIHHQMQCPFEAHESFHALKWMRSKPFYHDERTMYHAQPPFPPAPTMLTNPAKLSPTEVTVVINTVRQHIDWASLGLLVINKANHIHGWRKAIRSLFYVADGANIP